MVLNLRYAARSDVGLVRSGNEDSGYAGSRMLVVADGMGGHAAGELASATAVATFAALDVDEELRPGDDEILGLLAAASDEAHEALAHVASTSPESRGMGTTVTALAWLNDRVAVAHIGDSRAYLLRDGALSQLTRDHTFVQTLVEAGRITPAEAATHERRNLLMKALDGVHEVECDLSIREVRAGDRFLLSSDGLHGVVSEDRLTEILTENSDPTGAVTSLVEESLRLGAPDNVTALVADVVDLPVVDATILHSPIVVGAAAERRNRLRLPGVDFPSDAQPLPGGEDSAGETPTSAERATPAAVATEPTRRLGGPTAMLLIAALVLVLLTAGGWWWTRSQYFVGAYNGKVAVFQGIPQGPGEHGLATVESVSETPVADLPEFERNQVEANISADSVDDALRVVATLSTAAEDCRKVPTPAGCPPSTAPAPAPSPSGSTTAPTPTPSVAAPSPTPVAAA
ncbi:MAG: Serine/threonine-protein phosphatase [Actinomycetota bacterium]|nr:Serine/threonine-protein phosphatase [Actinomycetota bacterium]